MRTVRCQDLNDALNKLQKYVDKVWHSTPGFTEEDRRKWFKAVPEDSYGDERYRVELWVLEGSPVKQIVIINHCLKELICYSGALRKRICFFWGKQGWVLYYQLKARVLPRAVCARVGRGAGSQ